LADDWVALIKQVKEANDIVDVIGAHVALRPTGSTFTGLCPFHDDHRPSFRVDPRWQNYRCWSCGKSGDVLAFIQEHDRVSFPEALETLARRAGINLEKRGDNPQTRSRALMLEVVRWAAEQFHQCLLDSELPEAEAARLYLGERQLTGETVRRFGLGFAPVSGEWLTGRASQASVSTELLEKVGLIARRQEGSGFYDRFRDRVIFPIRDARGQTLGFGGRIMPSSAYASRGPKYYNSSETPLFSKSENLYGLDQARQPGAVAGYLAVVEGYTDVLMAHQMGVPQVVATMGTALNARHVQNLRRYVPRVVLIFDADAGGNRGVDRALEIFVSQDVELKIATLPEGLDPCDLLVQQGPEPFRAALDNAMDVLEFKLNQVWRTQAQDGVEGRRRAVDAVLQVIALAPQMPGQAGQVKVELMVNRIAQRLALKEETVWARLKELREQRRSDSGPPRRDPVEEDEIPKAPAPPRERQLLQVLLAEPVLVPVAKEEVPSRELEHPWARLLLETMYRLQAEGLVPDLDLLRTRIDNPQLIARAHQMREIGRASPDRSTWLRQLLAEFRKRRELPEKQELQNQLQAANDHASAVALLRQLQNQKSEVRSQESGARSQGSVLTPDS
jgi:DNA primase